MAGELVFSGQMPEGFSFVEYMRAKKEGREQDYLASLYKPTMSDKQAEDLIVSMIVSSVPLDGDDDDSPHPGDCASDCATCGEGDDSKCPVSQRKCGHHCNHVWTHDQCCWCGAEFGEEGNPYEDEED